MIDWTEASSQGTCLYRAFELIIRDKWRYRSGDAENWLISLVIWGEAELFLGIWGAKAKYF